ncbi:toxin glutamine deamidase domain-containing protein [Winogradskya humida]|nr:toxin glutamine deamidase domain-containing protein [Actinoplanes humidus]
MADEMGKLVEGCGRDLEGAKLEAWIEIGMFLIELIGMAVAVAMTLGAASPAAGGLIAATRIAIEQIFKRLVEQLGRKAIKQTVKEAGTRAAKQLTTREGRKHLGKEALHEGLEETREELATNGAVQGYQNATGRASGVNLTDLGMSAAGGFGGGFAAAGAHTGKGSHGGGVLRGAGAEVLGEFGGAAMTGNLPNLEGVAKSATSGATTSSFESTTSTATNSLLAKMSALSPPTDSGPPALSPGTDPATPEPTPAFATLAAPTSTPPIDLSSLAPSDLDSAQPGLGSAPSDLGSAHSDLGGARPDLVSSQPDPGSAHPDLGLDPGSPHSGSDVAHTGAMTSPPNLDSISTPPSAEPSHQPADSGLPSDSTSSAGGPTGLASSATSLGNGHTGLASGPTGLGSDSTSLGSDSTGLGSDSTGLAAASVSPPSLAPAGFDSGNFAGQTGAAYAPPLSDPLSASPATSPLGQTSTPLAPGFVPYSPGAGRQRGESPWSSPLGGGDSAVGVPTRSGSGSGPAAAPPGATSDVDRYFRFARERRAAYGQMRRQDTVERLEEKAKNARRQARNARRSARVARFLKFDPGLAQFFDTNAATANFAADRAETEARVARDPAFDIGTGDLTTVGPRDWHRTNRDTGNLAPGAVSLGNRSMLTGDGHPPAIEGSRRYGEFGGLRTPLAQHQLDVENAVPRDYYGNPMRLVDPRSPYFQLMNDGGPAADPTRGINCQDCVLSFFDTYIHGRPRVSAPRTFDAYRDGDPQRPLYGETTGPERVEQATGGRLQSLCKPNPADTPTLARQRVARALTDVSSQLIAGGHGSFAFLVNAWEGGSAHAWAAVNHHGEILYVDPQSGRIAPPGMALYGHRGEPHPDNLIALDALVVNGQGTPLPFKNREDGWWHPRPQTHTHPGPPPPPAPPPTSAPSPRPPEPGAPQSDDQDLESSSIADVTADDFDPTEVEGQYLDALGGEDKVAIVASVELSQVVAARLTGELQNILDSINSVRSDAGPLALVGLEHSAKTVESLSRTFAELTETEGLDVQGFLETVKDRVRFSVQTPESGYSRSVLSIFETLRQRGFRVGKVVGFWTPGGRHNGLNATVTDPAGFRFEVQFPTALSWRASKQTHQLYEILRLHQAPFAVRVDAFVQMLAINKNLALSQHQPGDLLDLPVTKQVDSTFVTWIAEEDAAWNEYLRMLSVEGATFQDILDRYGLIPGDVFGPHRSDRTDDRAGIQLPHDPEVGRVGPDNEHRGPPRTGDRPA